MSRLRWMRGWLPLAVLPASVLAWFPSTWPQWAFMWTLSLAIFAGCKWLTWRRTPAPAAPLWKHVGYLLAWPGMDAAAFLSSFSDRRATSCCPREWLFAVSKLLGGIVLLWGGTRIFPLGSLYLTGWIGMIGIVVILHFGVFHLLSCGWRTVGVDARPLMNWPLTSRGIGEFWGARWNTAFRDLTHRFVFRPLVPRVGVARAVLLGFFGSGVVHDLVISIPARGGYGGPTLFFLVQGCAILVSRSAISKKIHLRNGLVGWSFTFLTLVLPAPMVFHEKFVLDVIIPFMAFLGAIA